MKKYTDIIMDDDEPKIHNVLWLRPSGNEDNLYSLWFFNNGKWNQLTNGYRGPSYIPGEGWEDSDIDDKIKEEFDKFKKDELEPVLEEYVGEYFEAVKQYLEDNERVIANALARHEQWINENTFTNNEEVQ